MANLFFNLFRRFVRIQEWCFESNKDINNNRLNLGIVTECIQIVLVVDAIQILLVQSAHGIPNNLTFSLRWNPFITTRQDNLTKAILQVDILIQNIFILEMSIWSFSPNVIYECHNLIQATKLYIVSQE